MATKKVATKMPAKRGRKSKVVTIDPETFLATVNGLTEAFRENSKVLHEYTRRRDFPVDPPMPAPLNADEANYPSGPSKLPPPPNGQQGPPPLSVLIDDAESKSAAVLGMAELLTQHILHGGVTSDKGASPQSMRETFGPAKDGVLGTYNNLRRIEICLEDIGAYLLNN